MKKTLLILLLICSSIVFANSEMTLAYNEVKEGDVGIAYTVFEGQKIEEFYVEIIKKLSGEGTNPDFFLVNVYGDSLKKSKGILEGMSGSPVYVDGKLIGALSYTLDGERSKSGIVTPIKYMKYEEIVEDSGEDVNIVQAGSAISISPVFGDISIDEIGTLTYIKNNRFATLGHPNTNRGDIRFFLGKANIDYSFHQEKIPYKIGHTDEIIGEVLRDEKSGLYGEIKKDIKTYNFEISYEDRKINFIMPKNEKTIESYLAKALYLSIEKLYDTSDIYTGEYRYQLYKGENLVYSDNDFLYINDNFNEEFSNIIANDILTVVDNPFRYIDFDSIKINFTLEKDKNIIFLKELDIDKKIFKLGEELEIGLIYYIYQMGLAKEFIKIRIPDDFRIGNAKVYLFTTNQIKKELEDFNSYQEYLEIKKDELANNEILIVLESEFDSKKIKRKIPFDYYIANKKEFEEKIIIDSFEADREGIIDVK